MNLEICVEQHTSWDEYQLQSIINNCVNAVFSALKLNHYNIEICFLFTNDEEVKTLNKTYRGIDKATNVLSFPADSIEGINSDQNNFNNDITTSKDQSCCNMCILGSVAFAYETIEREAREQQKKFYDHVKHLIVHSTLHLLGYDHTNDFNAEQMENIEIQILSTLDVANPYE